MEHDFERFQKYVLKLPDGGCWLWQGAIGTERGGYGIFSVKHKAVRAHRFSYKYYKGEIPDGLVLDHTCNTRNCVNPNHLEPMTRSANSKKVHARAIELGICQVCRRPL